MNISNNFSYFRDYSNYENKINSKKEKKQLRKIENSLGKIENNLDVLSKIDLIKEQNLYFDSNSKEIRLDDHKFINKKKNTSDDKLKNLNKFAKFIYNYFKHNSLSQEKHQEISIKLNNVLRKIEELVDTSNHKQLKLINDTCEIIEKTLTLIDKKNIYNQFAQLIPSADESTLTEVINNCKHQFDDFAYLFDDFACLLEVFKNNEEFILKISRLIKQLIHVDGNNQTLQDYLIHSTKENKEYRMPHLMSWIKQASSKELEMLMCFFEWDLFNLGPTTPEIGYFNESMTVVDDFFNHDKNDIEMTFDMLNNLKDRKEMRHFIFSLYEVNHSELKTEFDKEVIFKLIKDKKETSFFKLFIDIKRSGFATEMNEISALADRLIQKGMPGNRFDDLVSLGISKDQIFHMEEEVLARYIRFTSKLPSETIRKLQSLGQEELDLIMNPLKAESENIWQHYVVRKTGWNKSYNQCSQVEYGNMMHHSVKTATTFLENKRWGFDELLDFLSLQRSIMACCLDQPTRWNVGVKRTGDYMTMCTSEYQTLGYHLWKTLWKTKELVRADPLASPKLIYQQNTYPTLIFREEIPTLTFREEINGEPIDLSIAFFLINNPNNGNRPSVVIQHSLPENAAKVMKFVSEYLYPEALHENDPEKLTKKLGEIFWWICQAKPWNLGDPSITEMLIRTIWTSKGLESPPWQVDLIPWVEVMLQPDVKVFADTFSSLFEWKK